MPQDLSNLRIQVTNSYGPDGKPRCFATIDNSNMPLAAGYGVTPQEALLAAARQWAGDNPQALDIRIEYREAEGRG
jgi:hypothetical protein